MAPLNSHFDGARQRVTNRRFSVKYTRPYTRNSTVGHKFFVTGGVKREMDIADISMARTRYFRNAFLPFLYRAPRPPRTRPIRARFIRRDKREKKRQRAERDRDREKERKRERSVFIYLNRARQRIARAHVLSNPSGIETDRPGRPVGAICETNERAADSSRPLILFANAKRAAVWL